MQAHSYILFLPDKILPTNRQRMMKLIMMRMHRQSFHHPMTMERDGTIHCILLQILLVDGLDASFETCMPIVGSPLE